jgi:hypothetical protein
LRQSAKGFKFYFAKKDSMNTPSSINDLAAALRERRTIIADETSRRDQQKHIARLAAVSEKIDQLQAALAPRIDPRLAHYLERRSYDKALEFLEQTAAPPPPSSQHSAQS